jgi:hypothetical protein
VGITVGSGLSVGSAVGRMPGGVAVGRAEGRAFGRAEAVGAGVTVATPVAPAAADDGVELGGGVRLAVGCAVGVGPVATGARRWVLHCNATSANTATMTTSASVDAPSAVRNDVLNEGHRGFLCMASIPPCRPWPAEAFYPRPDEKRESPGPSVLKSGPRARTGKDCPPRPPPPRAGEGRGGGFLSASSPCWRSRWCRSR